MRVLITGITGFAGSHLAEYILAEHPDVAIFGTYRWRSRMENLDTDLPLPPEQRRHEPLAARRVLDVEHVVADAGVGREVRVDELLGLLAADPGPARQAECGETLLQILYQRRLAAEQMGDAADIKPKPVAAVDLETPLGTVVCNAGIAFLTPVAEVETGDYDRLMADVVVNLAEDEETAIASTRKWKATQLDEAIQIALGSMSTVAKT